MHLEEFPEQTTVIAKDQPEYLPLPTHLFPDDPKGRIAFCWKLSLKERLLLLLTGKLWHEVLTYGQLLQPQMISLAKPKMKSRFPYRAWTCSKLLVTWCMQAQGAPLIDKCFTHDWKGNKHEGRAILLQPWKRNEHGDSEIQPALVIAWRQKDVPENIGDSPRKVSTQAQDPL